MDAVQCPESGIESDSFGSHGGGEPVSRSGQQRPTRSYCETEFVDTPAVSRVGVILERLAIRPICVGAAISQAAPMPRNGRSRGPGGAIAEQPPRLAVRRGDRRRFRVSVEADALSSPRRRQDCPAAAGREELAAAETRTRDVPPPSGRASVDRAPGAWPASSMTVRPWRRANRDHRRACRPVRRGGARRVIAFVRG